nr:MAG TPA: hypothetical protein [Caudoviricetes sp.]
MLLQHFAIVSKRYQVSTGYYIGNRYIECLCITHSAHAGITKLQPSFNNLNITSTNSTAL